MKEDFLPPQEAGISYTSIMVEDLRKEGKRLKDLGVRFSMEPREVGAVPNDTCEK